MKDNEVLLSVELQIGDKIKINTSSWEEFNGKIATIVGKVDNYFFNVDIHDKPFHISMFNNGTLIR